jgi:hypothetical protein
MDSHDICGIITICAVLVLLTANNLFSLFLEIIVQPFYHVIISKEISFFFYYFLSVTIWLSLLLFIMNLIGEKNTLSPNASFKEKLINFFIRENIKKVYFNLKDRKIRYSVLLSVMGGCIGIFSLGNLYNRLYKRFILQFILGLIITIPIMISIYNYPLTFDILDISYFIIDCPFAIIYNVYYILIINDCYECALSVKNNNELPSTTKRDLGIYAFGIYPSIIYAKNFPSIMINGQPIELYAGVLYILLFIFLLITKEQ